MGKKILKVKRTICRIAGHDMGDPEPIDQHKIYWQVYCRRCPFGTVGTLRELEGYIR